MSKKPNWIWHFYFYLYLFVTAYQAWDFFDVDSRINTYYHVLIAYNTRYIWVYCRNALSVILNVLTLVPFYLYLHQIHWLSKKFWGWFLLIRLASDLTGRIYEINTLKSFYYQNTVLTRDCIIVAVMLTGPSYIALLKYVFKKHRNRPA